MAAPLLVRVPNWLGDLVLAYPVLEAASRGPAMFAGPAGFRELIAPRFPDVPYVDVSRGRPWRSLPAIRAARPRAALLLTDSLSSALLAALAGIPSRIGYPGEGRSPLLTRRVPLRGGARSTARTTEYRVLGEAASLDVSAEPPRLRALPGETEGARRLLARAGASNSPYAVIAAGASYGPAKQWGPERFAAVAADLAARRDLAVVLVGSAADRPAAAQVAADRGLARARVVNLAGRTTLAELVGLLDGARAVVSNDSGVMHVAAALGRPTAAIFGSTSPVWTSASAPWVANVYAAYPCSPCYRRTCPIGYGCLAAVEPAEVTASLEEVAAR
jgi:heptosyltransferase-2